MGKKPKTEHCDQGYHDGLKTSLVRFLAHADYIGIQECIPPDGPLAQANCRRCGTTLSLPVTPRQIAQLRGRAVSQRGYYRFPLTDEVKGLIVKLAGEKADRYGHQVSRYSYEEIGALLVARHKCQRKPDPATIRRVVVAAGIARTRGAL
jgi:hypothetical protein